MADLMSKRRWIKFLLSLWPHWPLAVALISAGLINVMSVLRYEFGELKNFAAVTSVTQSIALLGIGMRLVLGIGLIFVGIGLLWRLRAAWVFAVLLVSSIIGVALFRGQRGASLIIPSSVLVALLIFRRPFNRRTMLGATLISLSGIFIITTYGTFGAFLLGDGFRPKISDGTAAVYFTIITLSTVGYGDIVPNSRETRIFTISLIIAGLGFFAAAIASTIGPALSGELTRIFNPKRESMKLKNHIILVGIGPIARNTAAELADRGIPYIQIVDQEGEPALADHPVVRGDATDDEVLKEAKIDTARMIIAAREDDGENAFITLAAKNLNPGIRVLAVAGSARSIPRLKLTRADLVFAPVVVGSRLLANLVEGDTIPPEFADLLGARPHKADTGE